MARGTAADTREAIAEMVEKEFTVRQMALVLGISTQAVYKHLKKLREEEGAA